MLAARTRHLSGVEVEMAAKHWAIGCGVGCLLVLVAVGVVIGLGVKFVGDTASGFEEAEEVGAALEERFPPPEEYVPPPAPPGADRVEVFLAVRESAGTARQQLSARLDSLPLTPEAQAEFESKSFFGKLGAGFGFAKVAADMGDFFAARNRALLEHDMGFGEYMYVYSLVYHGWLGKPADEGFFEDLSRAEGVNTSDLEDLRVDDHLLPMLERQLGALSSAADPDWRAVLESEIAALKEGASLPWQTGVPAAFTAAYEPYRQRLEASYDPYVNTFELMRNKKSGSYSYKVR
jgi:hypothetical protein